jgi:hypothetical protein
MRPRSPLAWFDLALIGAGVALLGLMERNQGGDGLIRFEATRSLLAGDLPHEPYSLVTPVLTVPTDLLGRLLGAEDAFAYRTNGVLFALGLVALWLLLRDELPPRLVRAFLLVLLYGSMFPAAVVSLFGETATTMLLAVGLTAIVVGRSSLIRILGWSAAIVAVVNTPALVPVFALVVVGLSVVKRSPWPFGAIAVTIVLSLVDIRLHTGGFTSPYPDSHGSATVMPFSGHPGFSYPAIFGVLAIVFSFGKGILFYIPGLFLPIGDRLNGYPGVRRTRFIWLAVVIGMVAVYCRWWAWYGGVFFGPRFFLFASVPAALAIAVRLERIGRSVSSVALSIAVLALSLWVGFASAIGTAAYPICTKNDYALEHLCWYTPEFSSLWRPVIGWPLPWATAAFGVLILCAWVRLTVPALFAIQPTARDELSRRTKEFRNAKPW